MINIHSLTFFDLSVVITMLSIAYLSKRLGEALKIKPFYKILYITSFFIVCASGVDIIANSVHITSLSTVSMSFRFISSAVAFVVCLRYWNWLFSEFLKN